MPYFFAKSIAVFYFTDIVFAKNPQGLILSAHFSGVYLCFLFFYFLTVLLLTEFLSMEIRVNKSAQKDAFRIVNYHKIFYYNKP